MMSVYKIFNKLPVEHFFYNDFLDKTLLFDFKAFQSQEKCKKE
jgi:hypothetical protein